MRPDPVRNPRAESRYSHQVVRTADRWRSLEPQSQTACNTTAAILRTLGQKELGWDYLTTPISVQPNESDPWLGLAESLRLGGETVLADMAFKAAYEAEPTNAQILWDRAQNLEQAGKLVTAQQLYRQIAESTWQPRFQCLVAQAKLRLN